MATSYTLPFKCPKSDLYSYGMNVVSHLGNFLKIPMQLEQSQI